MGRKPRSTEPRNARSNGVANDVVESHQATAAQSSNESIAPKRGRPKKPQASNGPTPEERQQTLAELTRLKTEAQRIAGLISTLCNGFKAKGGDVKALKFLHGLTKLDPREAQAHLETMVRYATDIDIKISWQEDGQGALSDVLEGGGIPASPTDAKMDLARARAHADGYNSGKAGAVPSDNPFSHRPGSEEFVAWHDGRDEGQSDRERGNPARAARVTSAAAADASMPGDVEDAKPAMPF